MFKAAHEISFTGLAQDALLRYGPSGCMRKAISSACRLAYMRQNHFWYRLDLLAEGRPRCGHDHFDFLRGDEAYKFQWATQTRRVATICVFDRRLCSRVFARFYAWSFDQMKQFARRYVLPLWGRLTAQQQATENEAATK